VNLESILEEWKVDCKIREVDLGSELFKTPMLHSKYLGYYVEMRAKFSGAEKKYNKMAYLRKRYYRGEMTKDELQQYGWEQFQGLKMSSSEFNQHIDYDPILCDLKDGVDYCKTAIQSLEWIMKQIQSRDWSIKSAIEYNKYLAGN
jgi:hypothetical protein